MHRHALALVALITLAACDGKSAEETGKETVAAAKDGLEEVKTSAAGKAAAEAAGEAKELAGHAADKAKDMAAAAGDKASEAAASAKVKASELSGELKSSAQAAVTGMAVGAMVKASADGAESGSKSHSEPITCKGSQDKELVGVHIAAGNKDGVTAMGKCKIVIKNSHIESDRTAINATGQAEVTIIGSTIKGRVASIHADGQATISYKDSTFHGRPLIAGTAKGDDQGGNTFHKR